MAPFCREPWEAVSTESSCGSISATKLVGNQPTYNTSLYIYGTFLQGTERSCLSWVILWFYLSYKISREPVLFLVQVIPTPPGNKNIMIIIIYNAQFSCSKRTYVWMGFLCHTTYLCANHLLPKLQTGPDSSVGRVSAPGNGRSRVRSRAATYQSRKKWY